MPKTFLVFCNPKLLDLPTYASNFADHGVRLLARLLATRLQRGRHAWHLVRIQLDLARPHAGLHRRLAEGAVQGADPSQRRCAAQRRANGGRGRSNGCASPISNDIGESLGTVCELR